MKRTLYRLAALVAVSLPVGCAPCQEYAQAVHASAAALEPYTHAGIDAAEGISPETRRRLHREATALTATARVAGRTR